MKLLPDRLYELDAFEIPEQILHYAVRGVTEEIYRGDFGVNLELAK